MGPMHGVVQELTVSVADDGARGQWSLVDMRPHVE